MSKDKNLIRMSDIVTIINPIIVDRCGYNLTKEIIKDNITEEQKKSVIDTIKTFDRYRKEDIFGLTTDPNQDIYDKIVDSLSFMTLRDKGFGGNERKLFTTNRESLRGKLGYVAERKVVKTGKYSSGYLCGDDQDYCPPYLDEEKTHVLFKISIYNSYYDDVCANINSDGGVWIEKCNLRKVNKTIN